MLTIRPIHLKAANEYVAAHHRHNIPTVGGKFAVSCYAGERLCGVAICGRPVSRCLDDGFTLEIYRNCTDGTYNACSKLYGACVRVVQPWAITGSSHIRWNLSRAHPCGLLALPVRAWPGASNGRAPAAANITYRPQSANFAGAKISN